MKLSGRRRTCVVPLMFATIAVVRATAVQSADNSESRPPVSKYDVEIVKKARQILDSPKKWNRADKRICPDSETNFSLYCALEKATYEVTGSFAHRGAAMQEARFVIDDDLVPNNNYHHRLMDYNNDPQTTVADVRRFFDLLQGRIEGRLEEEEVIAQLVSVKPAEVTQSDIEIVNRVEAILGSPAKWDRASTQNCEPDAKVFGLYCAFKSASISVTGKFDDHAPGIAEVRHLISRTANAA